jgi:hypothetical protein
MRVFVLRRHTSPLVRVARGAGPTTKHPYPASRDENHPESDQPGILGDFDPAVVVAADAVACFTAEALEWSTRSASSPQADGLDREVGRHLPLARLKLSMSHRVEQHELGAALLNGEWAGSPAGS